MIGSLSEVRQPRQHIGTPRLRASVTVVVGGSAVVCALAVVFGSTLFRTSRYWYRGERAMQGEMMGAGQWAGWTFLWGLVALAALLIGAWLVTEGRPRRGLIFALAAAATFVFAAIKANSHWQPLLDERAQPRDYTLSIASGLPIVTVAASAGAALATLLAILWVGEAMARRRNGKATTGSVW